MTRAVFLDRDGVVNRAFVRNGRPHPPASLEELELLPGAVEGISAVRRAGFLAIVVTNQPDVAAGLQDKAIVEQINEHIRRLTGVDDIHVCYHGDEDGCACRKPRPGMLLEAARNRSIVLGESFMIGDRWRDIAAGRAAGCRTILVGGGYGEPFVVAPHATVPSLVWATRLILEGESWR